MAAAVAEESGSESSIESERSSIMWILFESLSDSGSGGVDDAMPTYESVKVSWSLSYEEFLGRVRVRRGGGISGVEGSIAVAIYDSGFDG